MQQFTDYEDILSFPSTGETMNMVEADLCSILPAVGHANIRKPRITTHNFAHLMPLTSVWSGHEIPPNDKYLHRFMAPQLRRMS